jgi:hypothetical protein
MLLKRVGRQPEEEGVEARGSSLGRWRRFHDQGLRDAVRAAHPGSPGSVISRFRSQITATFTQWIGGSESNRANP